MMTGNFSGKNVKEAVVYKLPCRRARFMASWLHTLSALASKGFLHTKEAAVFMNFETSFMSINSQ